jgi:hypothetical protein
MKPILLILLIASLSVVAVPVQAQGDALTRIDVGIIPKLTQMQLEYGEIYEFTIKVVNLQIDLEEDEPVDPADPLYKFTGNLILDIFFKVGKEGRYQVGGETMIYNHTLLNWEKSYDIDLPKLKGSKSRTETHKLEIGYDGKEATLDEWVTFSMDTYVYIERYREISGEKKYYTGDPVAEDHRKFYVISDEKANYVKDALEMLNLERIAAKNSLSDIEDELGSELDVDLTGYDVAYATMRDYVDDDDYVSAMAVYSGFEPTWKDEALDEMKDEVVDAMQELEESTESYEELLEGHSNQIEDLREEKQSLQAEIEDITSDHLAEKEQLSAELEQLKTELSSVKSTSRLYLFGAIMIAILAILMILRGFRKT